jgi:segregation and condensation protein B
MMNEQEFTLEETPSTASVIEAVLFAAGYPIEYDKLAAVVGVSETEVREAALEIHNQYEAEGRGIQLVLYNGACQIFTREGFESYIRNALGIKQSGRLSASCLEVLAIIAYNQPVTKAVIEQIRGVDSSYALGVLSEKSLIEAVGRLDVPGKPNLYGTTPDFLRVFGLSSLDELPAMSDTPQQTTLQLEGI